MESVLYILVTVGVGVTSSLQIAMLGGIARERGAFEATWISMLASLAGMALVLGASALTGVRPTLPVPFNASWIYVVFTVVMTVSLVLATRGLPPYLAATGLLPVPYLLAATFIGPRIGLGIFLAAIITGQMIGAIGLDHIGAFGADRRPVDALRILGVIVLFVGVLLIRGRR